MIVGLSELRLCGIERIRSRCRVLRVTESTVWAAAGAELLRSRDSGRSFSVVAVLRHHGRPVWLRTQWSGRLSRAGFHHLVELDDTTQVAVVAGGIVTVSGGEVELTHRFEHGNRPLSLTRAPDGTVMFGEYWSNSAREPVRILASRDGRNWEPIYIFPAGSIRHIHGIIVDPLTGGLFVLTGDTDEESRILFTDNLFGTLECILSGTQQARAVAAIARPEGLYFATDTPLERNYLRRIDRAGRLEGLCPISGSGFHGCSVGSAMVFATAVEPSAANCSRVARLYASRDGERWSVVAAGRKDFLPMKLFQYGTFVLPSGEGDGKSLWFTPFALRGCHGDLVRGSLDV